MQSEQADSLPDKSGSNDLHQTAEYNDELSKLAQEIHMHQYEYREQSRKAKMLEGI